MNIKRLLVNIRYNLHFSSKQSGEYCRKNNVFNGIGLDVRLPAMILPLYPELVTFHNNIEVASGVRFVVHDAIYGVINNDKNKYKSMIPENVGTIEIMDNVFIGAGSIILPNVKIGPNVIIGAGSIICKDVPENSVCVGVPAKKVGTYDEYVKRMIDNSKDNRII